MSVIEYEGLKIEVDEEGYLVDYNAWSEKVACALAKKEGISARCPLGEHQMEILRFIRQYYEKFQAMPIVRAVCSNVHQPKNCEYVEFPDPVVASKIAGLPKLATLTGYELK